MNEDDRDFQTTKARPKSRAVLSNFVLTWVHKSPDVPIPIVDESKTENVLSERYQ